MKRSKKPLPEVEVKSYGRYTTWDRNSKSLPQLLELTETVKAEVRVEFGMLVEISKGKGRFLDYRIDHPPFADADGNTTPPFEGTYQVRSNPHTFFLGDTIWEPVEDKTGDWTMSVFCDGVLLASRTVKLV